MRIGIDGSGCLVGVTPTALVGISAMPLLSTATGPALIAIPMAGGVISAFAPGAMVSLSQLVDSWDVPKDGLDRPGFACIPSGNSHTLLLPGFARDTIIDIASEDQMDASLFGASRQITTIGVSASEVLGLTLSSDGLTGFATLRGGGLASVRWQDDTTLAITRLSEPVGLAGAVATDLESRTWDARIIPQPALALPTC